MADSAALLQSDHDLPLAHESVAAMAPFVPAALRVLERSGALDLAECLGVGA